MVMAETQKLDRYPQAPGCDYFTGSTRTPCIDTGITIDRMSKFGRVYVSEDTVGNWARLFGWIAPDEAEDLKDRAQAAEDEVVALTARVDQFDNLRTAIEAAGFVDALEGPSASFPRHVGGPFWELSNGERFKGSREDAETAELDVKEPA